MAIDAIRLPRILTSVASSASMLSGGSIEPPDSMYKDFG